MLKVTPFSPAQPQRAETRFSSSVVLSRPSPCNVPPVIELSWQLGVGWVEKECASVAALPAALLGCHFEHPEGMRSCFFCRLLDRE